MAQRLISINGVHIIHFQKYISIKISKTTNGPLHNWTKYITRKVAHPNIIIVKMGLTSKLFV